MSYGDEWFRNIQQSRKHPKPVEPVSVAPTTWKPWAKMTAEERRKVLSQREDATSKPGGG